jgi:hypothetical protein
VRGRRPLRLLAGRRMPRGGGGVALGTIRRSLPSAKAALITATREENADPAGCRRRQGGRGRPGGLAWAFRKLNALPPYGPQRRK